MKTRTLLLLSVGVGLMILLAGGVLLLQLANESAAVEPAEVGDVVRVGDVDVVVFGADETDALFSVDVEVGGVDDDLAGFSLATGDRRLQPVTADADGRCTEIAVAEQRCRIEFDVSAADGSNRVLILRRGDQQRNWVLETP
ncbi:MAG TPA: hypothetical protein VMY16_15310 [Ilumatobacteraceae bacterium]|nr:hypothetical protein [Ilumatobacteraceae bacterium]